MQKRRAFSLLEIMVSISLMAALAGIMMANTHGLPVSRQPLAVAQLLQAECKRARSIAVSRQIPVAICFPCAATPGMVQSFYCLQGETPLGASWSKKFSGDLPNAYLFVGRWSTASGASVLNTPDFVVSNTHNRNWSTFVNPVAAADPMLIFTPAGTAFSPNGLSHFSGAFHLVACNGASSSGAGPSSTVSAISHPQTVVVSESGDCWIEPGLTDAASTVAVHEGTIESPVAPPPAPRAAVKAAPVITQTASMPVPPGTSTAILYPNDYVRMAITASSPDGSPLRCHWQCSNGKFSSSVPTDMTFDPVSKTYTSYWEWHPDPGVAPTNYRLVGVVESALGGVATTSGSAAGSGAGDLPINVKPKDPQYCYYRELMSNTGALSQSNVCRVRTNGAGQRTIASITANQGEFIACRVVPSPVLNKVAFATVADGGPTGVEGNIYVCNADGTNLINVAHRLFAPSPWWGSLANVDLLEPVWAPDKKSLVYSAYNTVSGYYDLMMVDFRVANPVPVTMATGNHVGDIFCPQFTADSLHLVYLRGNFYSYSTNVDSDTWSVETCAWTYPGYPTKSLYTVPGGRASGYGWGIVWPSANMKMTGSVCLYMINGIAPGGVPSFADYGSPSSVAHGWPLIPNGHYANGPGVVKTGYTPGQGVSYLTTVDPGPGPGFETYIGTASSGAPSGTLGSLGDPLTQAKFAPSGDKMVGQMFGSAGDNTRSVVVANALGDNSSMVRVGHLDDGVFFYQVPQFTFTADARWVYYYSWHQANWYVNLPGSGDDYNFWASPSDGSSAPRLITRMTPGVIRRNL